MRDRPVGLTEGELMAELAAGWSVDIDSIEYLPVGAGSYHWSVADRRGERWFVKADDLGVEDAAQQDAFARLQRSLTTALALHRAAGLDFLVTPIPTADGSALRRLSPRYAVSVFPMVDAAAGDFGPHRPEDLPEMARLLAALHRATPVVAQLAPRADLRLPGRDRLFEALHDVSRPWTSGPYAEPARELLARHAGRVRRWLDDVDRLVECVRQAATAWVVTHGEPHPGNVMRTSGGLRLIDWGTVQIAPAERDLWMLTSAFTTMIGAAPAGDDAEVLARYTQAGGRAADPAGIALYARWWALADVAAFIDDLRRPHGDGDDAAAALTFLAGYLKDAT